MKRIESELRLVVPAMNDWSTEPGQTISGFSPDGDPRDPTTDLSRAYFISKPFVLQPSYFMGFIVVTPFSIDETERLTSVLGDSLSDTLLEQLDRAIREFICTISLQSRLATWKNIEDQLQLILKTCETLIFSARQLVMLTNPKVTDASVSRGALSAEQLVKHMLMSQPEFRNFSLEVDLECIVSSCNQSLIEIKSKTKRGRKRETTFRLFLKRLTNAMKAEGLDVKIPSNDSVFNIHPTFLLVEELLDICIDKGKMAISDSQLEDVEKNKSIKVLSQYRKSTRALVHYFRDGSLS